MVEEGARQRRAQEARRTEEERVLVLNNMEELEQKVKELSNQMEESVREVRGGGAARVGGLGVLPCFHWPRAIDL